MNGSLSASPFSCCPDRQKRRPGLPVGRRPRRSRGTFRKTVCSAKRTRWTANRPFPAKSCTTNQGPFGEVIRSTGPIAKVNPIRFSTKYQDDESDLLYYGFRYYKPSTGTWVSRDPLTEPGFYSLITGHQVSENSSLSDGDSDSPNLKDFLTAGGPNIYIFVDNDSANRADQLGLVAVGFYGAEVWGSSWDEGNVGMKQVAEAVRAPIYRSLDIWDPYSYLLKYFLQGAGACNSNEKIKIFGYSWGGISAVKLSRWIGRSALRSHETDVYVIDPVSWLRSPPTSVPSNVTFFWNRYQTAGIGVTILGIPVHGRQLVSYAHSSDQVNVNPSGPNELDHFSIVFAEKDALISQLRQ